MYFSFHDHERNQENSIFAGYKTYICGIFPQQIMCNLMLIEYFACPNNYTYRQLVYIHMRIYKYVYIYTLSRIYYLYDNLPGL